MCNTMMRRGRRKSANVYFAAAVILMCYLAQTIDCYRLRKTERREGRREADAAKTIGVQEGRILFGTAFQTESQDIDGTKKSNASVEDEAAYQADSTGWSRGQTYDASSKEASWRRMAPSLQCGGDQLKFRAVGPGVSHFAVEQRAAPPTPLSQVPSTCGYNMQRNSLGLVMMVPYDGCNMVQEGGSYVLPMRWQGVPVSLWCPKPTSQTAPEPQMHQVPQMYQVPHHKDPPAQVSPYFWYPGYPKDFMNHPVTTAAPTTAKPATAPPPKIPVFNPAIHIPWVLPPHAITAAAATTTTTTTTTTTAKPQLPPLPYLIPLPYPPFYRPVYPTPKPQTTTTTKQTTTTKKTPPPPVLPPFPFPYHPLFHPLVYPTAKPTTTPTTTTKKTLPPPPVLPPYPFPYPPLFPLVYPTPKPQTTTKPTTTTKKTPPPPVLPPFPFPYHPLFPPLVYPTAKPTTTTPTTTPTTTTTTKAHVQPHYPFPYGYMPYHFAPAG